ncbi:DJ-1/PfpI family protein [Bradyrhizobium sp. URHC0002]
MNIGMLIFPGITAIDYVGPSDLLARIPDAHLHLVWKHRETIETDLGWEIRATTSFADCDQFDMIVVPGGPGIAELLADQETLRFLRSRAATAKWIVGICTGPLVLGAAGLLEGYAATCHWASHQLLGMVGATPVDERVVVDRNRITGAGMTSGIDCALRAIALATNEDVAQRIQLFAEYDPRPPFDSGTPHKAPPAILEAMLEKVRPVVEHRRALLTACQASKESAQYAD